MTAQRSVLLFAMLLLCTSASAYKQADMRKIAAPVDTAIKMFVGYDSRTGQYKEQCIKNSPNRSSGTSPDAQSVFKMISSMNELTEDRSLDVSVAVSVNMGVGSGSASVDTNFESEVREKVESKAAYARFTDLAAPAFVSPNSNLKLNQRGQEAFKAVAKGKFQKFEQECGDSVLLGFQKAREFRGIGTLAKSEKFEGKKRDIKTKVAARYMMAKMSASVSMSKEQTNEAKSLNLEINYTASGDPRVRGASNFRQLRKAFEEFSERPLAETQTYRYVYVIPYTDLLNPNDFSFGIGKKQLKRVNTILNGVGVLQSARNTARLDYRHGVSSGLNISKNEVETTLKRFNRELSYLTGKMRESRGCLGAWNQECKNLYLRFSNFPSTDRDRWIDDFMKSAYRAPVNCNGGYIVTNPSGRQLCRQCSVAKEPAFLNGQEAACRYIVEAKPSKKHKRIWTKDLIIKKASGGSDGGNFADIYPDFCNNKNKGCGKKAANRLCKSKNLGEAQQWDKWDWKPRNHIHSRIFLTQYKNGKSCGEAKNDFTPTKCRTFKYIDCALGEGKKSAKGKGKSKGKNKSNKKLKSKS